MLDVGCFIIRVDSIEVLNAETDNWVSRKWVIERCRVDRRLRLERRIGADDALPGIKRHLIKVEAISGSHRRCALLKRIPSDSETRREIIRSSRNGLAKRRNRHASHGILAVSDKPIEWITRSCDPRSSTTEDLKGLTRIEVLRIKVR